MNVHFTTLSDRHSLWIVARASVKDRTKGHLNAFKADFKDEERSVTTTIGDMRKSGEEDLYVVCVWQ